MLQRHRVAPAGHGRFLCAIIGERSTVRHHSGGLLMSIVDDLIENLVERNAVALNGAFTIALVDGGITIKGTALSTLRDQKKNKAILKVNIPVDAELKVGEIVIPLPDIP
jgi:hypothetical protein